MTDNREVLVEIPEDADQFKIGSFNCTETDEIATLGEDVYAYPIPPVEIAIEEMVFATETIAVAIAGFVSLFSIIKIFESSSGNESTIVNSGNALFTYIEVSSIFTFLINFVVGLIVEIKLGLALDTKEPLMILSCFCFIHLRGLCLFVSVLIPMLS